MLQMPSVVYEVSYRTLNSFSSNAANFLDALAGGWV
jgi:hypothetical protein